MGPQDRPANGTGGEYGTIPGDVETGGGTALMHKHSMLSGASSSPATLSRHDRQESLASCPRNGDIGLVVRNETIDQLETASTLAEIDAAIDTILPMSADGARIIRKYKPQPCWLWRQWYGTVFHHGLKKAAVYMLLTTIACVLAEKYDNPKNVDDPVDNSLTSFNQLWKYLLTLTTFILTFFLNQSYNLWRQVYNLSRSVQGRTNDFGMLLATHAARDPATGMYTPAAKKVIEDVAMAIRVFHVLVYATKTRIYRVLHTDRAMARMVERGVMSREMKDALQRLDISPSNRVYALMEWITVQFRVGLEEGTLKGGAGFEEKYLEKALLLRSQYGTFGDLLDARIPLAYGHLVQVMVDVLLFCAPFACYKDMGYFAIAAVGILSIFFAGLLDLSKVMLDPLDNEDYCDGVIDINVGVFIRESNGGSVRFYKGAEHLPKSWLK